jgi:uncharacterized membrane protein
MSVALSSISADVARIRELLDAPPSLDARVKDVASLVSISLALTTLFVNDRLKRLDNQAHKTWDAAAVVAAVTDALLFFFVAGVVVALSPLAVEIGWPRPTRLRSVLPTMFMVAFVGFVAVALVQLFVAVRRVWVPEDHRRRNKALARPASGK